MRPYEPTVVLAVLLSAAAFGVLGFCVGAVEKRALIDGTRIQSGDAIIGIASSGAHSTRYSLIRRIVERALGAAYGWG